VHGVSGVVRGVVRGISPRALSVLQDYTHFSIHL